MKILLIASYLKDMMPYCLKYEKILSDNNIKFDFIFWNRFSDGEISKENNAYIINKKCSLGGNKLNKILPYFQYRNIVMKIIKRENYDKIIIFNTLPALFLLDVLLTKYKNKYIFDYRDYTYEKNFIYRKLVNLIIKQSYASTISSRGFLRFLNESPKIYITHNISFFNNINNDIELGKNTKKIVIGFVGLIRYELENKILITQLKNSKKYYLNYVGEKYYDCNLEEFVKENNIKNVLFQSRFKNNEKEQIYSKINIINAVYGNKSLEVTTALPNKLYDCLIYKKPIIASKGTYLGDIVEKNGLGITFDIERENIQVKLDEFIDNFNKVEFLYNVNKLLNQIMAEEIKIECLIKDFSCKTSGY